MNQINESLKAENTPTKESQQRQENYNVEKSFGRLRYLSWMVLINLIFLVPFKISDGHGWFLLVLLLHGISMSNIIVKRMDNIDPLKSSWVVTLWLIVYLGLGIWFYIVSAADTPFVLNMGIGYNPIRINFFLSGMLTQRKKQKKLLKQPISSNFYFLRTS
jgi:hypothetical protein